MPENDLTPLTFVIWTNPIPEEYYGGDQAEVTLYMDIESVNEFLIRRSLQKAFSDIWGVNSKLIKVMLDKELQDDD